MCVDVGAIRLASDVQALTSMPCTFALINALIKVYGAASSSSTAIVATTSSRSGIMTPRWFRYEAVGSHTLDLVPEISLVQVIVIFRFVAQPH